jgi:hypothetical protein
MPLPMTVAFPPPSQHFNPAGRLPTPSLPPGIPPQPVFPVMLPQLMHTNAGKPFDLLITAPGPIYPGAPGFLDLHLHNQATGRPPSKLEIVHEKPAHIFIVNQDLTDFQHVHPQVLQPGLLRIPVNFKAPGAYKLFIQFTTPENGEQTLNKPFLMGQTSPVLKPMRPDANQPKTIDGYTYRISGLPDHQILNEKPMSMFNVEVLQNGRPVKNIQPFLGAGAHGVIISQNQETFAHTHPMSKPENGLYHSPIQFHTTLNQAGLYKVWVQTQIDGKLRTVDWNFEIKPPLGMFPGGPAWGIPQNRIQPGPGSY